MANQEHLDIILHSIKAWNRWRLENPDIGPNLSEAELFYADLNDADLSHADLNDADLSHAKLIGANLMEAALSGANLEEATFGWTELIDIDLSQTIGLETVKHLGPSYIDIQTIINSQGKIPEIFLRKAGIPESIITQIPALIGPLKPIDYYTCFISYSSKNEDFAERLYADLQRNSVRCWFAPHELRPGEIILEGIDRGIGLYDKLLLILSKDSVESRWVKHEVEAALYKEMDRKQDVLFPIRLDNAVLESKAGWATRLHHRHIGDFMRWKNHDDYQQAFIRLLRNLKAESL